MRTYFSLRTLAASLVAAAVLSVSGSTVVASDHCHTAYTPQCYYKTVTVYEYVKKPCVHYVTKYDHCGEPYYAKVVTWKTVEVPVQKQVKVCY
jgi:hypothetical protein